MANDDQRRMITLTGARNVRDLGGYPAADGRPVAWGRLYRAAELNTLTDEDLAVLNGLGLRTFIDFRRRTEIAASHDRRPASLVESFSLPIDPGDFSAYIHHFESRSGREVMAELYRAMIRDFQAPLAEFLAIAAEPERGPLLFHCAAGKDRTGLAAALLLSALGVGREVVFQDYLLSNVGLGDKYADILKTRPELAPAVAADALYLEAAWDLIDRDYGGMEDFLTRRLRADRAALRNLYLD